MSDSKHGEPSQQNGRANIEGKPGHSKLSTHEPDDESTHSVHSHSLNGFSGRDGSTSAEESEEEETFHDAEDQKNSTATTPRKEKPLEKRKNAEARVNPAGDASVATNSSKIATEAAAVEPTPVEKSMGTSVAITDGNIAIPVETNETTTSETVDKPENVNVIRNGSVRSDKRNSSNFPAIKREKRSSGPQVAEWSHQRIASREEKPKDEEEEEEVEWQAMPAIDEFDIYDDDGRLVAKGIKEDDTDDENPYSSMGGAGKGYTKVLLDEDARSATSLDDDTEYLFKKPQPSGEAIDEEDEYEDDQRDTLGQLQATKQLLTEGQRIAYVGVVRLTIFKMLRAIDSVESTKGTKKDLIKAAESMDMWGQQMMVRLYKHMDIDTAEQLMIEQLAEHGLEPADLAPPLMLNAKVKNPMATDETESPKPDQSSRRTSFSQAPTVTEPTLNGVKEGEEVPEVHGVEDMPQTAQIELDIRWTVLCDLFLVLISDGVYDARSRRLLERVGTVMEINWTQICRFEKRVIDQLEMEETAKENWDESDHLEDRRKKGLKKKYVYMGLATVGGGLVIGLSAGLLAPVIGAGLAAGFTTIGVTGTGTFLAGIGGAAIITSAAATAGGTIAIRASSRRTGHVKTFEYRPLHNNKRLNLILTVSGWMTGKVDDVRLPFSTVDPIMGDIYSLYWEPELLRSMGDTINILATEALTTSIQQVLAATFLTVLMAGLQLPVILTKLSYLIDNPWSVSLDRANAAGLILADSLIARHLGQRPITLVGFSLGARVVFSCLKELAHRNAYGIVQNVYLFGSPIVANKDEYLRVRSIIAGRFVNGYAGNDWILGYLFRATSGGISRVAGLASVEGVPGLENIDVADTVNGHMAYRASMPKLLRKLNWEVESDEFTEIEDPDPENHAQRQRELIAEIDEARRKAEEKPNKRRFGLWRRGKLAEKQEWENYKVSETKKSPQIGSEGPDIFEQNAVLFDIDAIRKELIAEHIEVRELASTAPPMQFATVKDGKQQTEYLRLPSEIKPEEVAKMKLPPRPDEIDDGAIPQMKRNSIQKTMSTPATPQQPQDKLPRKSHDGYDEYEFDQPRELVSTLPPLRLTPQVGSNTSPKESDVAAERPELKKHETAPTGVPTTAMAGLALGGTGAVVGAGFASHELGREMGRDIDLGHNAWAEEGEVQMTFE